jgi:hypothetical protein
MKRTLFTLLLIANATCQISYGQTKTYNGSFNTKNFKGNVTYDYIEATDKRLFQGPFIFKNTSNTVSINGQFKADNKSGQWRFLYNNVASTDIFMKNLVTLDVVGNYVDGNLDGQWKLSRTKTISFNNNEITEYYKSQANSLSYLFDGKPIDFNKKIVVKEKCTANFNKNHFISNFNYSVNDGSSIVKGVFDSNGYYDSIWTVKYYDQNVLKIEYHHFSNGVLTLIKNKDNSTGNINIVYDKTKETIEFFQNYNEKENLSKIGKKYYKLLPGSLSEERNSFLKDAINIWYNNSNLLNYSGAFEVERGSNIMSVYPLRQIVEDYERIRELQEEEMRVKEEIERKKRVEEAELERKEYHELLVKEEAERKKRVEEAELKRIANEKENQEIKKREQEEKAYREYESSDLGKLKKAIKLKYSVWLEKKEAETEKDYKKRIEQQGQVEFDNIVKTEIEISKKETYTPKILSASLQPYNQDSSHFEIKLYGDYNLIFATEYISFEVPKNQELFFSNNYISKKPGYGSPILAYVLETTMVNNKWTPSKIFFVFDNSSSEEIDSYVWNKYFLINKKGKYTLERPGYSSYKPIKLISIRDQLHKKLVDDGMFYFEWSSENKPLEKTFTIESLGIVLVK